MKAILYTPQRPMHSNKWGRYYVIYVLKVTDKFKTLNSVKEYTKVRCYGTFNTSKHPSAMTERSAAGRAYKHAQKLVEMLNEKV